MQLFSETAEGIAHNRFVQRMGHCGTAFVVVSTLVAMWFAR